MTLESNVLAALVGSAGVLCVALLGVWIHGRQAQTTARIGETAGAYSDYITAIADLATTNRPEQADARARLAAAKGRIAIYGDASVVEATASVKGTSTSQEMDEFLVAVEAMRKHVGANQGDMRPYIRRMLFK